MADRFFAIDDQTFLFPDQVRDAYLTDIDSRLDAGVTDAVANMPDVVNAVTAALVPLTSDTAVASLLNTATTTRGKLDARYQAAVTVLVDTNTATDDTAAITAAIATGRDVEIVGTGGIGIAKTTATIVMNVNAYGQRLTTRNAYIAPAFVGDALQVTTNSTINVQIRGTLQPTTGNFSNVAAIRIGGTNNGYDPQHASVAYSDVLSFNGSAIIWEGGSMIDFTHFHADHVTQDGIRCTNEAGPDNNHGWFANTHIVYATGRGYAILGNGSNLSAGGSRHHVFQDAKAFGCGTNFYIESRSNVGTIFSELSVNPSTTTANSRGNKLDINETAASFEGWVDAGLGNEISGYSVNNTWETKSAIIRKPTLGSTTFSEVRNGQFTIPSTTLAGGASTAVSAGVTGLGTGRAVIPTLFSSVGMVDITPNIDASGNLAFVVRNASTSTQTITGIISYVILRFG